MSPQRLASMNKKSTCCTNGITGACAADRDSVSVNRMNDDVE